MEASKCQIKRKHPFSVEEDSMLIRLVGNAKAIVWSEIAQNMPGRTPKQCRERWTGHLNPSVYKGPWTPEEDRILEEKQAEFGNRWARIAQYLPGRTDTCVKNRWNTTVRFMAERRRSMIVPNNDNKVEKMLAGLSGGHAFMKTGTLWLPPLQIKPKIPA